MMTRVSFSIDDTQWPRLHIAGERISSTGEHVAFEHKEMFDRAYLQFENLLHNHLRPAVEDVISRRKQALS